LCTSSVKRPGYETGEVRLTGTSAARHTVGMAASSPKLL